MCRRENTAWGEGTQVRGILNALLQQAAPERQDCILTCASRLVTAVQKPQQHILLKRLAAVRRQCSDGRRTQPAKLSLRGRRHAVPTDVW